MSTSAHPSAEEADDPEISSPSVGPSKPRLLRVLGPGLITGASDDDPSGIATYGQAGAQLGYGLCWTMLYTLPLMAAVQMVSARIGRTTGHGIAGVPSVLCPSTRTRNRSPRLRPRRRIRPTYPSSCRTHWRFSNRRP
ncbi:divalent metal cation transporter, partial [Methylobacterium organophilum]|nr:divalent metal cation transporter [Methylobacterium organophilum]